MRGGARLDSGYWDQVAGRVREYYLPPLLAAYKSRQYSGLIDHWGGASSGRVLVTDLYEAAFGDPALFAKAAEGGVLWTMDISPSLCRAGQERLGKLGIKAGVICCDSRTLPFKQDCFALIISPSTFDHFPELDQALGECRRTLQPGGRLLLALNSASNPLFRLGVRLAELFKKKEYETGYFYTAGQVRNHLKSSGLKAGRQIGIMHVPLGLTTIVELMGRVRGGSILARGIVNLCQAWDVVPKMLGLLTGWWVASEAIKNPGEECR
jgi:SAM-dependent methyltransferase